MDEQQLSDTLIDYLSSIMCGSTDYSYSLLNTTKLRKHIEKRSPRIITALITVPTARDTIDTAQQIHAILTPWHRPHIAKTLLGRLLYRSDHYPVPVELAACYLAMDRRGIYNRLSRNALTRTQDDTLISGSSMVACMRTRNLIPEVQ